MRWSCEKLSEITLGTAQIGSKYGVANTTGKPSTDSANAIFDVAHARGITCFDTSSEYGESEKRIGEWVRSRSLHPAIVTKLPQRVCAKDVEKVVLAAREVLCSDTLDVVLVHGLQVLARREVVARLRDVQAAGLIGRFGASVYTVEEAEHALNISGVEVLQIPLNVFNWQFVESGFLSKAFLDGKILLARSIFCQGLLLLDPQSLPPNLRAAKPALLQLSSLSRETNLSRVELAVGAVRNIKGIASFVIGAETADQVKVFVDAFDQSIADSSVINRLMAIGQMVEERVYDPRKWKV